MKHIIIAGTTKAATTSLFHYLEDHPQINPSSIKETRFFLDSQYPLPAKYNYEKDKMEQYYTLFQKTTRDIPLMEATPDYLYGKNTPIFLTELLPDLKLIFLLRNPTERFISWYKFARQVGKIDSSVTFREFYEMQERENFYSYKAQHLQALIQGRYSHYLNHFLNYINRDNILIVTTDSIQNNLQETIKKMCSFCEISTTFYNNYDFKIYNKTQNSAKNAKLQSSYRKLIIKIKFRVHKYKLLNNSLRLCRIYITDPFMKKFNTKKEGDILIDAPTLLKVKQYYETEDFQIMSGYNAISTI